MQFNLGIVISSYNWSETVVRISVTGLSSEKDNLNHFAIILPSLSMLSLCLQSEQVKKMKKVIRGVANEPLKGQSFLPRP